MSSSDSGPDDRTSASASKKAKVETKDKSAKKRKEPSGASAEDGDGELEFSLSNNRFVNVREFRGKTLIDVREYYMNDEGERKPGKKGISLSVDQWKKLMDASEKINSAIAKM